MSRNQNKKSSNNARSNQRTNAKAKDQKSSGAKCDNK